MRYYNHERKQWTRNKMSPIEYKNHLFTQFQKGQEVCFKVSTKWVHITVSSSQWFARVFSFISVSGLRLFFLLFVPSSPPSHNPLLVFK